MRAGSRWRSQPPDQGPAGAGLGRPARSSRQLCCWLGCLAPWQRLRQADALVVRWAALRVNDRASQVIAPAWKVNNFRRVPWSRYFNAGGIADNVAGGPFVRVGVGCKLKKHLLCLQPRHLLCQQT